MSAKRIFSDRFLRSLKPAAPGKRYIVPDAAVPHFGIRVTEHSRRDDVGAFVLISRFPGSNNPTPRKIGEYPAVTLAAARAIAREWNEDLARGVDPKAKQAEQRRQEEKKRADTFAATFESYALDHLPTLRTGAVVRRQVEVHVFPVWGDWPISSIHRADYKALLKGLSRGIPIGANRIDAYLKRFFGWAVDEELIESSPAASVKRPSKEVKRDRVLTDVEIRAIWEACGGFGAFGHAVRLMLATGQRRTEVGSLAWPELDRQQAVWRLPAARTKANRGHEVPLSALTLSIIGECPRFGDFVFSSGRSGQDGEPRPISGWSKGKLALDRLALERLRALAEERGEEPPAEFPEWHLHDLRRSVATNLARLGVDRVVISKILNHSEGGVTAIYDRHRYHAEMRRALDLWAQRLAAIVAGGDSGNVVTLAGRASTP